MKRVSSLFVIFVLLFMLAGCPSIQTMNDSTLKALLFNSLSVPNFDPEITEYTIELPRGTTEVPTISTVPNIEGVTIEVINAETIPGTTTIIVTALDGETVTTYYIYFTVQKNNDSSLKALEYNAIPVPGFRNDKLNYEVILPAGSTYLPTISATANDPNATITITQVLELPGTAFVTVTAEDGVTTSTYSIHFIPQYFIEASSNPSDGGKITGSGNYLHGTHINLIATANEGYEFIDWTDNGVRVSTNASYSFTVNANRALVANFKLKTYTLTTIVFGQGTVDKTPDNATYSYGDVVQLTAYPEQGWNFTGWSGDISGSVNPAIIIMEKSKTVGATFAASKYTITATAGDGGSISPSGIVFVNHGEDKTFTITPNEGYIIGDLIVDGQTVGPNNSFTFNDIAAEHSIHAVFTSAPSATYTVTINVSDDQASVEGASVAFNGETKNTDSLGRAVFSGVPSGNATYTVSKEGYNDATGNLNVDGDKTVDVFLVKKTYILAITLVGQGVVTKNPDKATYSHGEVIQLTAYPLEGWTFAGWNGDILSSENPVNVTMNEDKSVTAIFETIPQYTLTIEKTGNGKVTVDPAPNTSGKYTAGTDVTLTAVADAGWQFVKWVVGEEEKVDPTIKVTMDADQSVVANFEMNDAPEFDKLLPANGAVNQPVDLKLEWNAVDPNGATVTYDVYFGYSSDNLIKVMDGTTLEEYYPDVIKGFTFYWRVVASNGSVTTDSGVIAFSTIEEVLTDKSVHIIDNLLDKQPSDPATISVQVRGIGVVAGSELEIEIDTDYMEFIDADGNTLSEFLAEFPGSTYEDFEPWCEYKATSTSFLGIKKLKDALGSTISLSGAYTNSTGRNIEDGNLWFVYVRTKDRTGKAVAVFSSVSFIDAEFNEIPVDSSDEGLFIVR